MLPALLILGPGPGLGLIFSTCINSATAWVDPADAGVASATVNTMQQGGGSIHSYATVFWRAGAFFAVGMVACGLLLGRGATQAVPGATPALAQ